MATIRGFEEIEAWQSARELSIKIFNLSTSGPLSKDWGLRDQVNRSSGSVMDNIAEGFGRGGTREFVLFLSYAKGSANELKSQLIRMKDRGYIDAALFHELNNLADLVINRIGAFMYYLNSTKIRGSKFKLNTAPEK